MKTANPLLFATYSAQSPNIPNSKRVDSPVVALPIWWTLWIKNPSRMETGTGKNCHSYHPRLYTRFVSAAEPNWFYNAVAPIFHCAGLYTLERH